MEIPPASGIVTLLSDFGLQDPYVGIMKGVIKQRSPRAECIDLSHGVPPQNVEIGALFVRAAIGRFPAGTVHVAVVDPGVGTARRFLAVCAATCYWLAPDNGLLDAVFDTENEIRTIDLDAVKLTPTSRTFHGRDVFAPVAGLLSSSRFGFRALGPRVNDPVRVPKHLSPRVIHVDAFGNLVTNLKEGRSVRIAGQRARLVMTYGDAKAGELVALVNSWDLLEIAVVGGSAAQKLASGVGAPVEPL